MAISEVRFFHAPAALGAVQNRAPQVAAPLAAPQDSASLGDSSPATASARVDTTRQMATAAAASLTAQGGLPLVPSVMPSVLQSVNTAPAGLFIETDLRSSGSTPAAAPSLATLALAPELTAGANRPGGGGKGFEKGSEKGREKGAEKGFEKGREKGEEKGFEKGREKGAEKGEEKGREKGSEKGREKGAEKGAEKGHEKGGEKPAEHPVHLPSRPPHDGPKPPTERPSQPPAPPTRTVHDGGHDFKVPPGGWVTNAQRQHPDMHTGVIDRNRDWRNQITNVRDWHNQDCGPNWIHTPHGFYSDNAFWSGFDLGQMESWDWANDPVYCVSPVTGDDIGQITPPDGGFSDQDSAYQAVLNALANPAQDPNDPNYDSTAGLYAGGDTFDPNNPGTQMRGDDAFQALSNGQPLYFHPPNGDWEAINSLDDLNAYLYTMEQQPTDASGSSGAPATGNSLPPVDPNVTLQMGDGLDSNGPDSNVLAMQQRLAAAGYQIGTPDGEFGAQTLTAVKAFQTAQGLTSDGIVGAQTIAALNQIGQN